jgi:hypothetical protein
MSSIKKIESFHQGKRVLLPWVGEGVLGGVSKGPNPKSFSFGGGLATGSLSIPLGGGGGGGPSWAGVNFTSI